jgi:hypothetical protein
MLGSLAASAPGQQSVEVVGPGGAAGFDVNQWNEAVRGAGPSLQLAIDVGTLLPWQEQKAEPSARQLAIGLLGICGAGSTMRVGPHKQTVKALVGALKEQDFPALPRSERMLSVLTLYEVAVASRYQLLFPAADQQASALAKQLAAETPLSLPAMDLLLLHLLAMPRGNRTSAAELVAQLRTIAHAAGCSERQGTSRRIDAALLLVRRLRGESVPDDLLLAVCWPSDPLLDPQHTWIGGLAAGELPAAARAPLQPQLDRLLAARRADTAPQAGSWDPAAGCDRSETTAWHLQSLQRASAWKAAEAAPAPEVGERR